MKQRPSFPARLDAGKTQAAPKTLLGATRVVTPQSPARAKPVAMTSPTGVGLESSTIRARMVKKLADQGIEDAAVLEAMGRVERHRFSIEPQRPGTGVGSPLVQLVATGAGQRVVRR